MKYNWQDSNWPTFRYELGECEADLLAFAGKAGQVSGILKSLPEGEQSEAVLDVLIAEAIKTSEIEGEYLSRPDVVSSIRNQLGLNAELAPVHDPAAQGIAELMVAVRNSWAAPLDETTLFAWHEMLMKGSRGMAIGCWRTHTEPIQVVSGQIGRPKVHYEAPPSARVPVEMAAFVQWFNDSLTEIKHAPVRSAIAHLYFESIHPFEDGNGRIGRAIAEKALSQGLNRPALLSLSHTIEANKKAYYDALETAQKSLTITPWVRYFTGMVLEAQTRAEQQIDFVLSKTKFFARFSGQLNERQLRVIRRMLEEGPEGFKGGMNARKYVAFTQVSKATATRDMQALVEFGIFEPIGKGRSVRYRLCL